MFTRALPWGLFTLLLIVPWNNTWRPHLSLDCVCFCAWICTPQTETLFSEWLIDFNLLFYNPNTYKRELKCKRSNSWGSVAGMCQDPVRRLGLTTPALGSYCSFRMLFRPARLSDSTEVQYFCVLCRACKNFPWLFCCLLASENPYGFFLTYILSVTGLEVGPIHVVPFSCSSFLKCLVSLLRAFVWYVTVSPHPALVFPNPPQSSNMHPFLWFYWKKILWSYLAFI